MRKMIALLLCCLLLAGSLTGLAGGAVRQVWFPRCSA